VAATAQTLSLLSWDDGSDVRCEVVLNPAAPVSVLERLAKDSDTEVRCWVDENPNTPASSLELLDEDEDRTDFICVWIIGIDIIGNSADVMRYGNSCAPENRYF